VNLPGDETSGMNVERSGQLVERGHRDIRLTALGTIDDGVVETGTASQFRLTPPFPLPKLSEPQRDGHGYAN